MVTGIKPSLIDMTIENYPQYFSLVFSIVGNADDSFDVLQNVCLQILLRHPEPVHAPAYLSRMCKNMVYRCVADRRKTVALQSLGQQIARPGSLTLWSGSWFAPRLEVLPAQVRAPVAAILTKRLTVATAMRQYGVSRKRLRYWQGVLRRKRKPFYE